MISRIVKSLLACAAIIAFTCATVQARDGAHAKINLVSDQTNTAQIVDTNLANAWGIAFSTDTTLSTNGLMTNSFRSTNVVLSTNIVIKTKKKVITTNYVVSSTKVISTNFVVGPNAITTTNSLFWVSANLPGKVLRYAVNYDTQGVPTVTKQALVVSIPGDGSVTGLIPFSDTNGFFNDDTFIFASEDGTIGGWRSELGDSAETFTQRVTAVYKGIGIATTMSNGPVILAANFAEGTVDEYGYDTDSIFKLLAQFVDTQATGAGFAPFNIQVIEGEVLVMFAKQDDTKIDDVPVAGNGIVDILAPDSGKFTRFITGIGAGGKDKDLNSPWGLAVSPASWDNNGNKVFISNFGDGTIAVYTLKGKSTGRLQSKSGGAVTIDGLWGLTFGNGFGAGDPNILYFTAGPSSENHGVFGSIAEVPKIK